MPEHCGPHQIFSQRGDNQPQPIRDYEKSLGIGGSDLPDGLVGPFLEATDIVSTILGSRNTIFLVDTSRPHRGLAPDKNHGRLVLSTTFRISNLGNP